jgi:hypothetical protein
VSFSKPELQVLDYKTQQYALLPVLATSYAFWFTSFEITKLYFRVQMEINDGNLSNAQEVGAGNVYTVFPNILFYIPVFLYIPTYSPTYLPTY